MSFSDDPTLPTSPFSGDSNGDTLQLSDMVSVSPSTVEHIVDTQSGFLIIVKHFNTSSALSIKRRIGTPPSSQINLTPDESLKLSRIFSNNVSHSNLSNLAYQNPEPLSTNSSFSTKYKNPLLSVVFVLLLLLGAGLVSNTFLHPHNKPSTITKVLPSVTKIISPIQKVKVDPLEASKVDTFVRAYINNLLDFSPRTYQVSQITAMAKMTPSLMEKYIKETSFPLNEKQLNTIEKSNIQINNLKQQRLNTNLAKVDLKAQISNYKNSHKTINEVNLCLQISADKDGKLTVIDQKDISTQNK